MATRERGIDRGTRRGRWLLGDFGRELRDARLQAGLSQREVGRSAGISGSWVSRIEAGLVKSLSILLAAQLMAVVGRDLSVRSYPAGSPIRDAAHQELLRRFRSRISPAFRCRFEVPLPIPNDPRAFDMALETNGLFIAVEAETRLHDGQALARRLALKRRDGRPDRMILLVNATKSNRGFLRDEGAGLKEAFPLSTRAVLEALGQGDAPVADGIVLL